MKKIIFIRKKGVIYALNSDFNIVFEMNTIDKNNNKLNKLTLKNYLIEKSLIEWYNSTDFRFIF